MATTITRTARTANPARWQKALHRAIDGRIQVRQLGSTGQWIATSASDPTAAYELDITGDVAHGCSCPAGTWGDPVCCHRAAFYALFGLLEPEPDPPAPAPAVDPAEERAVSDAIWAPIEDILGVPLRDPAPMVPQPAACPTCDGTGSRRLAVVSPLFDSIPIQCTRCRGAGSIAAERMAA